MKKSHIDLKFLSRSSDRRCYIKKDVPENLTNSQENTCVRASFFNKVAGIRQETLAQVFSCGFCKIFKNNFFTEHLWVTVSVFPLEIKLY